MATLGWIEPHPILPRNGLLHTGPWGLRTLWRQPDAHGRHRYLTSEPPAREDGATALGSLFREPAEDRVALRLRDDGRLATDLGRAGRATRDPRKIGRWIAAPLRSHGPGRPSWTAAGRLARLARHFRDRRLVEAGGDTVGWLLRERAAGCMPLFSCTHPVTGDQLATYSMREAVENGYFVDGVLGYILETNADPIPT